MWIPELGDIALHVPDGVRFAVTKRSKKAGAVYLWDNEKSYPLAVCIADSGDRALTEKEIADLIAVCEVMTAEDLELLETLTPGRKRQIWAELSPELKEKLIGLREQDEQAA